MFGNQDDDVKEETQQPDLEVPTPEQGDDDQPAVSGDADWQHPGTPLDKPVDDKPAEGTQDPISDVVSPAGGFPRSTDTQAASHHVTAVSPPPPPPADDLVDVDATVNDLIDIRQHALKELAPMIDQLDLAPDDRFRTLMLVIQASDDQKLIKEAYEAAHGITDEKARAQALLEIVNEINYFTQQSEK
jgi:hypothetical protein